MNIKRNLSKKSVKRFVTKCTLSKNIKNRVNVDKQSTAKYSLAKGLAIIKTQNNKGELLTIRYIVIKKDFAVLLSVV